MTSQTGLAIPSGLAIPTWSHAIYMSGYPGSYGCRGWGSPPVWLSRGRRGCVVRHVYNALNPCRDSQTGPGLAIPHRSGNGWSYADAGLAIPYLMKVYIYIYISKWAICDLYIFCIYIYTSLFTKMVAHKKKIQTKSSIKKHTNHTLCTFTEHYNIYASPRPWN